MVTAPSYSCHLAPRCREFPLLNLDTYLRIVNRLLAAWYSSISPGSFLICPGESRV